MELNITIIGYTLILLAVIHVIFPSYFDWKKELSGLSLINRQMMVVHTFFIGLTVMLMGIFCVTCHHDIIHTALGHNVALGLSIFWGIRWVFQFFVYSSSLWKGKLKETLVHIFFSILWTYYTVVFFLVYVSKQGVLVD